MLLRFSDEIEEQYLLCGIAPLDDTSTPSRAIDVSFLCDVASGLIEAMKQRPQQEDMDSYVQTLTVAQRGLGW
jgi:hypothetical protein